MGVTPTAGTPAAGTDNQQGSRALPTRGASIRGGSGTPRDRVRCSPCWVGVMALGMSPRRHPGAECPPTLFHFPSRSSLPLSPTTLLLLPSSPKAVQTPRGTFLTAALPGLELGGAGQCHLHVPQGTPHLPHPHPAARARCPRPAARPTLPCPALPCRGLLGAGAAELHFKGHLGTGASSTPLQRARRAWEKASEALPQLLASPPLAHQPAPLARCLPAADTHKPGQRGAGWRSCHGHPGFRAPPLGCGMG